MTQEDEAVQARAQKFNLCLSQNAIRILLREAERKKVTPSMLVENWLMDEVLTVHDKVNDAMNGLWHL